MANELTLVTGTPKTLEANGAQITNGSVVQADDATYSVVTDGASFPHAKFVASLTFGTAPTEGTSVCLYARPINIDGTSDSEVPEATRPTSYVGRFIVNNVTTAQFFECLAFDIPWEAEYYLHNNATGQTISAGWTLKITPFSYKPAP